MSAKINRTTAIVIGVLVIFVVGAGLLSASLTVRQRDLGTPDGVVQSYLQAVFDRRSDDAARALVPGSQCSATDFDTTYLQQSARVDLVNLDVSGDSARVTVHVEFSNGDPFGGTYGEDHTYRLVRSSGKWLITGIPWPLYGCGMPVKS